MVTNIADNILRSSFDLRTATEKPFKWKRTYDLALFFAKKCIQQLFTLPDLDHVTAENFMEELENGVSICKLANIVNRKAEEAKLEGKSVGQVGQITL